MSSLLEKSLDEIIGSDSKSNNSRRRPFRKNFKNNHNNKFSKINKSKYNPKFNNNIKHSGNNRFGNQRLSQGKPNEIKISNLHPELTTEDLTKLMETVGPTKNVEIKLNTHGKSIGIAYITFEFGKDAMNAIEKFDGRLAAGQIIKVVSTVPLIDRISLNNNNNNNNNNKFNKHKNNKNNHNKPRRERKTFEDLDNELNSYMNGSDIPTESNEQNNNNELNTTNTIGNDDELNSIQNDNVAPHGEPPTPAVVEPQVEQSEVGNVIVPVVENNDIAME